MSDNLGIKLLTRLCLDLSHLREHKLHHNFQDTINLRSRSNFPFFPALPNLHNLRKCLMNELIKVNSCILKLDEISFMKLLLYGGGRYDNKTKTSIILASIKLIYSSNRFDGLMM